MKEASRLDSVKDEARVNEIVSGLSLDLTPYLLGTRNKSQSTTRLRVIERNIVTHPSTCKGIWWLLFGEDPSFRLRTLKS